MTEDEIIRYINANIVFSKFSRDYIDLKKDLPIRPSEMGVLNIITRREGLFTPLMIADLLGVSKPMIAAHISALEEKGYIYKESSSSDKRSFYVMPTEKARTLVDENEKKLNSHFKRIEGELGREKFVTLIGLLDKTQKLLEQEIRKEDNESWI